MDVIDRFVTRQGIYVFEVDREFQVRDNFRQVVTQVSRLPGVAGGFDEYGSGRAPNEVGNVQVFLWVFGDGAAEMKLNLDELTQIADWDSGTLVKRIGGVEGDERWCTARVDSIDFSMATVDVPHQRQRVQVNFQVADPYWYTISTDTGLWGDGIAKWGDGVSTWGGSATATTVTGLQNDIYENVAGTAPAPAKLEITVPAGKSATDVRVQRIVAGAIRDEVRWNATLAAADVLEIDARTLEILKNGADAYGSSFTFEDPRWFELLPGENQVRVLMDNASDSIELKLIYNEAWKK